MTDPVIRTSAMPMSNMSMPYALNAELFPAAAAILSAPLGAHRGVIFDMDGTLVDAPQDFALLCSQLGWPKGTPILEHLSTLPMAEQLAAQQIIHQFELDAALAARLMPDALELLDTLRQRHVQVALLTRNSKAVTAACLDRLKVPITHVITRDDAPAKPDPTAIFQLAAQWQLPTASLLMVGDYSFDLVTAHNAGIAGCLYRQSHNVHFAEMAHYVIDGLAELQAYYHAR